MRIFIAFGYNPNDAWIRELVFPIVTAFGDEVVRGDQSQGESISEGVRQAIRQSDALIGFATRRRPEVEGDSSTHRWVTDEITYAIASNKPVLEVREEGVDDQGGLPGDRQRVVYRRAERDRCLVEIVEVLGRWHRDAVVTLKLLPGEWVQQLVPLLGNAKLRCTYRLLDTSNFEEGPDVPTRILPITGGLFVHARGVPPGAMIRIRVEYGELAWVSDYEGIDSPSIYMRKE